MSSMDFTGLPESLVDVLRSYSVLRPTRLLQLPAELSFSVVHGFLLDKVLLNPHFVAYPPSPEYQKSFWKWAIAYLESIPSSEDDEIDGRLYDRSILLMNSPSVSQAFGTRSPSPSYFTYIWPFKGRYETVTLLESRTIVERGTTGMKTWHASLILAQYFIQHPEVLQAQSVLELGSGVGLLGLIVAALQLASPSRSARIRLTDVNHLVLKRCDDNVYLPCNRACSHPDIRTQELDWTDALHEERRGLVQGVLDEAVAETIIGADVVFDPSIIPALIETLRMALVRRGTVAMIALTVRNPETVAEFVRLAEGPMIIDDVQFSPDPSFWGATGVGDTDYDREVRIFKLELRST